MTSWSVSVECKSVYMGYVDGVLNEFMLEA